jgi:hypothetical protein
MPANYVLLESIELSETATSVVFNNIPQTGYTDLKIEVSVRTSAAAVNENIMIAFNGSTANFTARWMFGDGAGLGHSTTARIAGFGNANNATSTIYGSSSIYIQKYTSSAPKLYSSDAVLETNAQTAYQGYIAGLWSNNDAITSITLTPQVGPNFLANCTFSLYGISAQGTSPVVAPFASGGNIIANDGTYWYHAFTSSGSFAPSKALSCDVVVVAGGGGGGSSIGGGGGAGGLLEFTAQSLTATNYLVAVGAGGASDTVGADSRFGALTLVKGGGFGGIYNTSGNGGSGGGAGASGSSGTGGTAVSGQGNVGGNNVTNDSHAGGGGGKGAAGQNAVSGTSGSGGNGSSAYSAWGLATTTGQNISGTVWYAGGGGGGARSGTRGVGGNGGGGAGGAVSGSGNPGVAGTANTGGGAGGATYISSGFSGGAGGSGIVIVRYAV